MQLPPLDRTVSWPPSGVDSPSAGGSSKQVPRASRQETTAIQEAVAKPQPSVKIEISSAFDEIVKQEKAAQAKSSTNALGDGGVTVAGKPKITDDNDLSVKAATATQKTPETATDKAREVDTGKLPGPNQSSTDTKTVSKDWTEKAKATEDKPPEPPKEPISKKLLEFLQTLWHAGGQAINVADEAKLLSQKNEPDGPLTYSDPSAKKTPGV